MPRMTQSTDRREALARLKELQAPTENTAAVHIEAGRMLCGVLRKIGVGYDDICDAWDRIPKA